jgi:hypothetical protein
MKNRVTAEREKRLRRFEKENEHTIKNYSFSKGDLVLIRNTSIEKSLDRKMQPRYLGPYVVVRRNKGGSYFLAELDGSVLHRKVGAFRVIPYFPRKAIPIPDLDAVLDSTEEGLDELEERLDDEED